MVYFVIRTEYMAPIGRKVIRFPEVSTLADWFGKYWMAKDDVQVIESDQEDGEYDADGEPLALWEKYDIASDVEKIFGMSFYGMCEIFYPMLDRPCPANEAGVREFIESFDGVYSEGWIDWEDGAIQAKTDDDEIEIAWYLFDDAFHENYPERTSFLLYESKDLPITSSASPDFEKPAVRNRLDTDHQVITYCCFYSALDGMTLDDVTGCYLLPTALPDLGHWLSGTAPEFRKVKYGGFQSDWAEDLILLRAFLILNQDQDFEKALHAFDDFYHEDGLWPPRQLCDFQLKARKPYFASTEVKGANGIRSDMKKFRKKLELSETPAENSQSVPEEEKTYFQFSPHMCQAIFTSFSGNGYERQSYSSQWVFFDSYWAAQHPLLAESMLRYGRDENVLSA